MAENDASTAGQDKPKAHGTMNIREGSQVFADYEPTELYFHPETGDLLIVPSHEAAEFEKHCMYMCKLVDDFHKANNAVTDAITVYAEKQGSSDPTEREGAEKAVEKAGEKLKEANDKLKDEGLKPLGSIAAGGKSIIELIPIRKTKAKDAKGKQKQMQYGRKMTYCQPQKKQDHWRTYKLTSKADTQSGQASIITKDKNGKNKVDKEKLAEQLKGVTAKLELVGFEEHSITTTLTDWAKAWNEDLQWQKPISNNVDLSAKAQLMRFTAGIGAASEWSPSEGNVGLKAEAKADFAVAEARADAVWSIPDRLGVVLQFTGKKEVYPLGAFRMQVALILTGVVGASVTAELASEIHLGKKEMKAKGVPTDKKKLFEMDEKSKKIEIGGREAEITPIKAELGAFAGAKADVDFTGALQWLNPEEGEEHKKKEFKDFIKLDPALSGMAGAGLGAKFEVTYADGRFHILCSASVCVGLGLKGKFDATADAKLIGEFVIWFFYQLYHANYEYLDFVDEKAFHALKDAQFLAIQAGKDVTTFLKGEYDTIKDTIRYVLEALDAPGKRDMLAANVSANSGTLRHSTPETKGMLIYQLTRHGKLDWMDSDNYTDLDAYHKRKSAILTILQSVQTTAEWDNVFQHMTASGGSTDRETAKTGVKAFLNMGRIEMHDDFDSIEIRLKIKPTRGYAVAMNNTPEYHANMEDHPYFCMAEGTNSFGGFNGGDGALA